MQAIYYKRLFEVQLLHEYYLANNDGPAYFALPEAERKSLLQKKLFSNQYDIWQDLSIEPSEETKKLLVNRHLRFIKVKTGFFLGIKVKPFDNKFFPFISPDGIGSFSFHIRTKNIYFKNFTNLRLKSNLPANYYFSNAHNEGNQVFPSLTLPVATFKTGRFYELGEVAQIGPDVMEALNKTDNALPADWRKIDAVGFAHEGDKMLLPMKFDYVFAKDKYIKQADFTLKSPTAATLKTISISSTEKLEKVMLDFTMDDSSPPKEMMKGKYILEVVGENDYQDVKSVYLNQDLYRPQEFGVIEIKTLGDNPQYSLLSPDGSIKAPFPIFEIRLKSRITYWRYRSDIGARFKVLPKTATFLKGENGALRSLKPFSLMTMPMEFRDDDPTIPRVFLPNPSGHSLRIEDDGLVYSDIYTSTIKDLIAEDL